MVAVSDTKSFYLMTGNLAFLKQLPLIILITLFLCGCHPSGQKQDDKSATAGFPNPDPAHNAHNALDWAGTYTGMLPCADCEGIETILTIRMDSTFTRKTRYLGKGDEIWLEINGSYSWDEAGFVITLENLDPPNQYFVSENRIFHLDINGERITGRLADHYILKKILETSQ
jgi:copper homeostasis protein (lipoprotein)